MYVLSMLIHVCSCIYIHVYAFYPFSPSSSSFSSSGLPMNQIEMEKIADGFDANRTGLIDLSQIMAILKGHLTVGDKKLSLLREDLYRWYQR